MAWDFILHKSVNKSCFGVNYSSLIRGPDVNKDKPHFSTFFPWNLFSVVFKTTLMKPKLRIDSDLNPHLFLKIFHLPSEKSPKFSIFYPTLNMKPIFKSEREVFVRLTFEENNNVEPSRKIKKI